VGFLTSTRAPGPATPRGCRPRATAWFPFVFVVLAVLVAALILAPTARAQSAEYEIKAAFLCKFGNYVEWPAHSAAPPDRPFRIGIVAGDVVVDELARAAIGQVVNGRPIEVRPLKHGERVDGIDIIFVARSHAARLAEVLAAAKDQPILTVTESDPDSAVGSMVNFVVVEDKVKFDIALRAAESSGLKISSRLLAVARSVKGKSS
jgi:hypothetical protein